MESRISRSDSTPAHQAGGGPVARVSGPLLTVGVEEEFLLVDPRTRLLMPAAAPVISTAQVKLGDRVAPELTCYQVETRTEPHRDLGALAEQLYANRLSLSRAAAAHGAGLVSSGTPVLTPAGAPPFMPGARYERSARAFGALDEEQVCCACHVHVGMASRAEAVQVSNHLRAWIAVLIALAANSPVWDGRDTGHASWRTVCWARWPAAGPPPYFESAGHYDDLVATLIGTGVVLDAGGIYWDIRPSHHVPTLEVRVADAGLTVDDTVLIAALVRAAAATALASVRAGRPAPRPDPHMLRAASWHSAREGLTGTVLDPVSRRLTPSSRRMHSLLAWIHPALTRHGDAALVESLLSQLNLYGTGAVQQRAALRLRRRPADIVDHLLARTLAAPGSGRG
ncbi:carboxylate-amine ligase [Streptomyces alanosinicus]|uniref:Putative glutamate--cysteine ligase 2 n=1 Tax=Streptomyces alanosinicus TaxID=68171 RepID=A0A918YSF6_9ACTN|nr:glutamate--cysteine ligase [Streptomyces alanosinicus]GHE15013.1 putative glutamate--cysteine ligase 2-3 [Streptomyces alanosinicus]